MPESTRTVANDEWQPRLRFSIPQEAAFVRENAERCHSLVRYAFPTAVLILSSFSGIDALTYNRLADPVIAACLYSSVALSITVSVLAWITHRPRLVERAVFWSLAIAGLNLSVITARCLEIGKPEPYSALAMHTLYVFFLSGLLTRDAVRVTLIASLGYLLAQLVMNDLTLATAERLSNLPVLAAIAALGCHMQEYARRRTWLLTRRLETEAQHDELTGLPNRRALLERAERLLRAAARERKPATVMLLDLDHFKWLNDGLGHAAGDDALRRIACTVAGIARRPMDLAGRHGGEEFVVLLEDCAPNDARERAESLRAGVQALAIPHPEVAGGVVTVSIGVLSGTPQADDTIDDWAAQADDLLYRAKAAGRNRVAQARRHECDWSGRPGRAGLSADRGQP